MCGEIPAGHYAKDVVLHFPTNTASVRLPLPFQFEHVVEIRVNEITVTSPNGGAVEPNLWRLQLGPQLETHQVCNAAGDGYAFNINNGFVSYTRYDRPRVLQVNNRGQINHLTARLMTVSAANAVADPTFVSATVNLTFVMKKPLWVPDYEIEQAQNLPQNAMGLLSTKARIGHLNPRQ